MMKTKSAQIFPNESGNGTVNLMDTKIRYAENHSASFSEVHIDDLQYIYIVVTENNKSLLFLFDTYPHYIPTDFNGFKNVYEVLAAQFSLDSDVFFEHVTNAQPVKKQLWRRTCKPTYEILSAAYTDYEDGFEIQSPEKQFLYWDSTYEELSMNTHVQVQESIDIQKIIKFLYPVRIGNILLENFTAYYDSIREHVSVLQFYSACFDAAGTDKSYYDLKSTLLKDFGIDRNRLNYEREDQKNINYNFAGMRLSICYTYDSPLQFDAGYTSLSVENKRDYFSLLIDQAYEDRITISDYVELQPDISISEDYNRNSRIKRRPKKITDQFAHKAVIWLDVRNSKIGFSSKFFSQVFDANEIICFRIQNILPARGTGGGQLELMLEGNNGAYIVMKGDCYAFDTYAEKIKTLTGKDVTFEISYPDC